MAQFSAAKFLRSENAMSAVVPQTSLPARKKNIIICCDGTGNQFGDSNSNVVKLYTALTIDNDQVGYYHPGVGTMGDPGARSRLSSFWSVLTGLAFGTGFKANVLDAYRYLMETYNDGDHVHLFGFSRGAYTARALAGLLDGYGLLCKGNEGHIPYAWRLYLNQLKHRSRQSINEGDSYAAAFKETYSHDNFRIRFVGLWDTVSSVGWVSAPLRLFNVAQNRSIDIIRHAVSIDERRCFYQDNLYGKALSEPPQDVKQVWFAGVHSDIGGSYSQDTSGLSNITLKWMIDEAKSHRAGILFEEDRVRLVLGESSTTRPATEGLYHTPSSNQLHVSLTWPWWLLELLPHRYYDKDDVQEQRRIPFGSRRKLPCGALVHHSVQDRLNAPDSTYRPKNLRKGTLTVLPYPLEGSKPLLYEYKPRHDLRSATVTRLAILIVVTTIEILAALWALPNLVLLIWHCGKFCVYWAVSLMDVLSGYLHRVAPWFFKLWFHPRL